MEGTVLISKPLVQKLINKENIVFRCKEFCPIAKSPNILLAQCYSVDTMIKSTYQHLLAYDKNTGKQLDAFTVVETDKSEDGNNYNYSCYGGFDLKDSIFIYILTPEIANGMPMPTQENTIRLDVWCIEDNGKFKLARSTNYKK